MYQQHYETKAGFYKDVNDVGGGDGLPLAVNRAHDLVLPNPNENPVDGPKISCLVSPEPSDEELQYLRQLGVTHTFTWISNEQSNQTFLDNLKQRLTDAGLELYNVGNRHLGKSPHIILGDDKRDETIGKFQEFLRMLSKASIKITTFTWEGEGIVWNTHKSKTRGETEARAVDERILSAMEIPEGRREYTEEELWANMQYFLDRVLPVAEECGVQLALHPNDPPMAKIRGLPCLMRNKEAYERVYRMAADSSALGMEFCCGCWLEGGDRFGNLLGSLAEFVSKKKVLIVHLRNVTAPMPVFTETFIDGGYGDMYKIIHTLAKNHYTGTIILDHTPDFVSSAGKGASTAFSIGYMKASLHAAHVNIAESL